MTTAAAAGTIYDIKAAKAAYEDHITAHHCLTGDGCPARLAAWQAWMHAAETWGQHPAPARPQRKAA